MPRGKRWTTEILMANTARSGACDEWSGLRDSKGYGSTWLLGRKTSAHRVSWHVHFGAIPGGACVLHRCDNPPCVRPDHLFLGDRWTNSHDMRDKGRSPRAKLTPAQVAMVRMRFAAGDDNGAIAGMVGVGRKAIAAIRRGDAWRTVRTARQPRPKLTPDQVRSIRMTWESGDATQLAIARAHGLSENTVWMICNRVTWKHIA